MEIQGQGQEHQLLAMGKYTDSLYLTFQMSPGMKMSSPPVELSYSLAEKVTTEKLPSKIEMDDLCQRWMATQPFCWPFDDSRVESHVHELNCEGLLPYIPVNCVGKSIIRPSEVPDIELNVELSQRWPYCNTVLVDVKPWALLVNRIGVDIYLVEQSGKEWKILSGSVFVPPPHQEQFSLGVQWLGELYLSKPLLLSQDDWSAPRYWPKVEGRVPLVGHALVFIQIVTEMGLKICPLCITSTIHEGVRVIAMNAAWFVSNQTETDLLMITCMVASSSTQIKLFSKKQKPKSLKLKAAPENNRLQPVLFWDLTSPVSHDSEYQQYVCLAQKSSDEPVWSHPVCVTMSVPDSRLTVSVPEINGTTKPYLVMIHKKDGLTYLITKN
ncbi:intermembrane lipid transfer protein VPS13B-like [Tachypleus tridentatus]|uniref:intermembrane lipid transfer protein VPS13B-like n=1 Tax=Tachypleus tridentatus TaxID=6853 RepID=UPI003FD1C7D2